MCTHGSPPLRFSQSLFLFYFTVSIISCGVGNSVVPASPPSSMASAKQPTQAAPEVVNDLAPVVDAGMPKSIPTPPLPPLAPEIEPVGAEYLCLAPIRQAVLERRYVDAKTLLDNLDRNCAEDSVRCDLWTQVMHGIGYHDALEEAATHPERSYIGMRMYVEIKSAFAPYAMAWLKSNGGAVVIKRAEVYCKNFGMSRSCFDHIAEIDSFAPGSEAARTIREIVSRTQAEDRHDRPILVKINRLRKQRAELCTRSVSPWCKDTHYEMEVQLEAAAQGRESPCSSRGDRSPKVMKVKQQFEALLTTLTKRRQADVEGAWQWTEERCIGEPLGLPELKMLKLKIPPL